MPYISPAKNRTSKSKNRILKIEAYMTPYLLSCPLSKSMKAIVFASLLAPLVLCDSKKTNLEDYLIFATPNVTTNYFDAGEIVFKPLPINSVKYDSLTVTISVANDPSVSFDKCLLTFTANNWTQDQKVLVFHSQDYLIKPTMASKTRFVTMKLVFQAGTKSYSYYGQCQVSWNAFDAKTIETAECEVWGDPHVRPWNREQAGFDFNLVGKFELARTTQLIVYGRLDYIMFEGNPGSILGKVLVNYRGTIKTVTFDNPIPGNLTLDGAIYSRDLEFKFPDGSIVRKYFIEMGSQHLKLIVPKYYRNMTRGLCGILGDIPGSIRPLPLSDMEYSNVKRLLFPALSLKTLGVKCNNN